MKKESTKILLALILVGILLMLITLSLTAVTLNIVDNRLKQTTIIKNKQSLNSEYAQSIKISDVMAHLNELQRIATNANGTRAANTHGFNQTFDYIYNHLSSNTDFNVVKSFFDARDFILTTNPILLTSINDKVKKRKFSNTLSEAEFYVIYYTKSANFSTYLPIRVIPNLGCDENDWIAAKPSGQVVLVKRGICYMDEKAAFASKYNVTALLIYNDGTSSDSIPPIYITFGQTNQLIALFLSFTLGQELADAAQNPSNNVSVRIIISMKDESIYSTGNICADTPTGNITQTIVIGSHSDSALEGPGINDNGSGTAANLGLAIALARLFQTSTYAKYKYRIRFCWWGAEEVGLQGSTYHVEQTISSTIPGERFQDYLINLNYDMLGSYNYIFGIYDGRTANNNTPVQALPGSIKITDLFRNWFVEQNLPWNYTDFTGQSDYRPFLAEGLVAGGLFSGAYDKKTYEQRDFYDRLLGERMGGIGGAAYDPCYHQACDTIQNINVFAYEKMIQAAAYVLEYLARQDDLNAWLYPNGRTMHLNGQSLQRKYNSINEYYGMPYL